MKFPRFAKPHQPHPYDAAKRPAATHTSGPWRVHLTSTRHRIQVFMILVAILMSIAAGRAVLIQGFDADGAAQQAAAQMSYTRDLIARRGAITDRNGVTLAQTLPTVRVVADPYLMARNGIVVGQQLTSSQIEKASQAPNAVAEILVNHLGGTTSDYLPHLTKTTTDEGSPNQYELIATQVPAYTFLRIQADLTEGGWYGLFGEDTPTRVYPDGTLASNVVGFLGGDEQTGLAGIEQYYDAQLRGTNGKENYEASTYGRIPLGDNTIIPAEDGHNVQLTLDTELQYVAQQELAAGMERAGGESGVALALNIKTGEVLAMANAPSFDSNSFSDADAAALGNGAVETVYEPGSVHKIITMAALADQGLITPDTQVEVPASLQSGADKIYDSWSHDTWYMTARGVLSYSSNIGTALLSRLSSKEALASYWDSFGLGTQTGIELPGEGSDALGIVPNGDMPDYVRDRAAFGQSISVTALQEAAAIAAVANGGVYNSPTVVAGLTDSDGNEIPIERPESRRVISAEASAMVLDMMESVTADERFNGSRLIAGYRAGGKTGTAERVDPTTGTYSGYTASYVSVAPIDDPQILVYVVIQNPSRGKDGGTLAMPVANKIMVSALSHFGVPASPDVPAYTKPLFYEP